MVVLQSWKHALPLRTRRSLAVLVLLALARPAVAQVSPPLQIVITPAQRTMNAKHIGFRITLRNVSEAPLLLNGGVVLGNGRHAWAAIDCTAHGREGRAVPLGLHWRLGGVGGRMYMLGVALGPGDTLTIAVTPDDYSQSAPLPSGPVELQCRFTGRPSNEAEWPATWVGSAVSAPVEIELTNEQAKPSRGPLTSKCSRRAVCRPDGARLIWRR